jgi:hypothetical protein
MSRKEAEASQQSQPDFEVRYSEKLLREQKRERRKSSLATGLFLPLVLAPMLFALSLHAYRTHTWIDMGRVGNSIQVPPIVGVAIGAMCLLYGLYCLWDYFNSRK